MRYRFLKTWVLAWVLTVSLACGTGHAQVPDAPNELAFRVRAIFAAKCSECHGRSLQRPRAALYLDSLGPVAANGTWVVPGDVEGSYLWHLIRDDDMPAKGAKAGPLSAQEKESVRAWIATGAPVGAPAPSSQAMPDTVMPDTVSETPAAPSLLAHFLGWLGKFHVVIIHFPIALLTVAALAELLAARRLSRRPEPMVRSCVLLGAGAAVVAVVLGWLHADVGGFGGTSAAVVVFHRLLGTVAGAWTVVMALLSERESRRGQRTLVFRSLLWSGALLVAAAGHFGGLLVHGDRFFEW
jgi:mono/diheme cytochrome c family protein/uncharacterized membrane protein